MDNRRVLFVCSLLLLSSALTHLCSTAASAGAQQTTNQPPVVKYVYTDKTLYGPSDLINVTVMASDDMAVTRVTADGVDLVHSYGSIWEGAIHAQTALGQHSILVRAYDSSTHTDDSSCSYETVRVAALTVRALFDGAAVAGKGGFLFVVCGTAQVQGSSVFYVSDGSGTSIKVQASGHGVTTGNWVRVKGIWYPFAGEPYLDGRAQDISKY